MIGWLDPRTARLAHPVRGRELCDRRAGPRMIEPAAAIVGGPIGRAVAPPGVEPLRRRIEMPAEIDPVMARLQAPERRDLDRRMADDVEQLLVAPDIAFERGDVEIAYDQGRLGQIFGPARHPLDEIELLPEFRIH